MELNLKYQDCIIQWKLHKEWQNTHDIGNNKSLDQINEFIWAQLC